MSATGETGVGVADAALDAAKALADEGKLLEAWRAYANAVEDHPGDERLLAGAADLWVSAVDRGAIGEWPLAERRALERTLIAQEGCAVSPPIFAHRISAQHSAGVKGHLRRAADALAPTLLEMLDGGKVGRNLVLMLLLLRSQLDGIGQRRISALHRQYFKSFGPADLALPYSVMFHRADYQANVDDLAAMLRDEREQALDGSWPLTHLLHVYWLVPDSFAELGADWSARAVGNSTDQLDDEEQLASARSLAMRFDGNGHRALARERIYGDAATFTAVMDELAKRRADVQSSPVDRRAEDRLQSSAHRAANAAFNVAMGRAPALAGLRRKPKVALCISGQLRGFKQSLESWKRLVLPAIDATIFVSSWQRVGRAGAEPFRYVLPFEGKRFCDEYRSSGIELGLPELQQRYPSLFAALEQTGATTEDEVSRVYGTPHVHLDDDTSSPFAEMTNPEKMHCKIEHAFRMAEAIREEFDLIIRTRPDKPVKLVGLDWRDLAAARSNPVLHCEMGMGVHYGALEIGDQFAVGGPGPARIYGETFSRSGEISRLGLRMFHSQLTGHVSLAQMCWLHGIDVRRAPIRFGPLQDPEPLSAEAIRDALQADSAGRMDDLDRRLIAANASDLAARRG